MLRYKHIGNAKANHSPRRYKVNYYTLSIQGQNRKVAEYHHKAKAYNGTKTQAYHCDKYTVLQVFHIVTDPLTAKALKKAAYKGNKQKQISHSRLPLGRLAQVGHLQRHAAQPCRLYGH